MASFNCFTGNPRFVDAANGDFRLQGMSPCIDMGNNQYVTSETDIRGNARIQNGIVDIGAYEFTLQDMFEGLPVAVGSDGNGGWLVTITGDIDSADLPIELPDNIGPVTIDLNGHDLIGGDGDPAIRIVPVEGDGAPTQLTVVNTEGGTALVQGGEGSPAIVVGDGARDGVIVNIGEGVIVRGGEGAPAVVGEIGTNAGGIVKVDVEVPDIAGVKYTGSLQTADVPESALYGVVSNEGGVDAGVYPVELRLADTNNYCWAGGDSNPIRLAFAIGKATNAWTTNPSIGNWTYGQAANTPNMGAAKFGTVSVSYSATPQDAGDYTATFTVAETDNYTGLSLPVEFTIGRKSIAGATVTLGPTLVYSGAEQTQEVLGVKIDGLDATFGVSGNKATETGTYTLTVTGTGNFTGSTTAQWRIRPDGIVEMVAPYDGIYDGAGHGILVAVTKPEGATVKYAYAANGPYMEGAILFTDATETAVTVWYTVEAANYTTVTNCGTVKISPKPLTGAMVALGETSYTYDGTAKRPAVTVADGNPSILTENDYEVAYSGNVNAGEATVTVTGKGNYTGTVTKHFDIAKAEVTAPASVASKVYTGERLTADISATARYTVQNAGGVNAGNYPVKLTLTDAGNYRWAGGDSNPLNLTFKITKATNVWTTNPSIGNWTYGQAASVPNMGTAKFGTVGVTYGATGSTLPTDAGTYTATFKVAGTANYTGLSEPVQFTIARKSIAGATVTLGPTLVYSGAEQTQEVLGVRIDGLDATFVVSGDKATEAGAYTLTVTGTGNFTGSTTAQWRILPDGIIQQVVPFDGIYDGEGHGILVTVTKPAGAAVKYAYAELGPYATDEILFTNATETAVTVWYTVEAANYTAVTNCGTVKISPKPLTGAMVALEETSYTYDGTAKRPAVTVADGNPSILTENDYEVAYSGNVNAGEATVTVTGKGNYTGTVTKHFDIAKQTVAIPAVADKVYMGGQQTATVPASSLYNVVQNAGGVDAGQYDVKLRLVDPVNYAWSGMAGADVVIKFTITKAENAWIMKPSIAGWTYGQAASVPNMGFAKFGSATVSYSATPQAPGTYAAMFTVAETASYSGLMEVVHFTIASREEEMLREILEDIPAVIELDGTGGWTVTLTNDIDSADLPIEIPDDLGHVTIDLGGHDLIGADGADGDGSTPGGDGTPAIRIVPGEGGGDVTRLSIVTTGGDSLVRGGDGGAGTPGGNGAPAIEVADGCHGGVLVDVGAGVTVRGGDGGASETGRGGDGGAGIDGDVGRNDGTILGGNGGGSVSGDGGDGGPGVDGSVDVNSGSIRGGDGGASVTGRGGDGGMGVTGGVGTNDGTIGGGSGGVSEQGEDGRDGRAVGGTVGGGTGTLVKVKVPVPEVPSAEYTGEELAPQVPESSLYVVSATGGTRPGSYPVMITLLDATNYEWIPREGATVNGALAVVEFVIANPPPRIETEGGERSGRENAASVVAVYDGVGHGISVKVTYPPTGATVRYALTAEGPFADEAPLFTNAVDGAETWYEVSAAGFDPVTNMATVTVSPRSLAGAALGSLRFESVDGVRTPVPSLVDDLGHEVPPSDYAFAWTEDESGAMTLSFTGRGNYLGLFEKRLAQTRFRVTFDANGGEVGTEGMDCDLGTYYGVLPVPSRAGYVFDGWYEKADLSGGPVTRNTEVVAADITLHAKWLRRALWYTDAVFHLEGAATYDGYLIDPDVGDAVAGTIQVKAGKPNKKTGMSKLTVTVQVAGQKKVKVKGTTYDGAFRDDGAGLSLALGFSSLSGSFGRYAIDGARNIFKAKDSDSKLKADQALKRWQGTYVVAWRGDAGWNGLSVNVKGKGKAKVSGTLADGTKVSASSQLLVGERECALAVSWTKKGSSVACLVWLCEDGSVECANLPGGARAQAANARTGAYLPSGAALRLDAKGFAEVVPGALEELLPDGLEVRMAGAKFEVDKAGKVKLANGAVDMAGAGTNPSGLKLTYSIKSCTFKGSFSAYSLQGGKLKKTKVNVSGVVLGGKGYGTAYVKKAGSAPVTVE